MNGTSFDCLCAGIVVADHLCEPIEHLPQPGELVLTERTNLAIGGCAANVAVDLARLGAKRRSSAAWATMFSAASWLTPWRRPASIRGTF